MKRLTAPAIPPTTPVFSSSPPLSFVAAGTVNPAATPLPPAGQAPSCARFDPTGGSGVANRATMVRRPTPPGINSGQEAAMGMHARLADVAVDEAMEAQAATRALLRVIEGALADGVVTPAERDAMLRHLARVNREVADVVAATERANVGQKLALSLLTVAPLNPHVRRQARDIGLDVPAVIPFPGHDGPLDAA